MAKLTIRPATSKDLPILLEFEQGVISAERPLDPTLKREHTTYYNLTEMLDARHIHLIVAELNGEIVSSGYARIENASSWLQHQQFGYLGFMYTLPEHRGKGIIKQIINALVDWCATQDIHEIRLDVYHGNTAAIKAYEKAGFEKHLVNMRLKRE